MDYVRKWLNIHVLQNEVVHTTTDVVGLILRGKTILTTGYDVRGLGFEACTAFRSVANGLVEHVYWRTPQRKKRTPHLPLRVRHNASACSSA